LPGRLASTFVHLRTLSGQLPSRIAICSTGHLFSNSGLDPSIYRWVSCLGSCIDPVVSATSFALQQVTILSARCCESSHIAASGHEFRQPFREHLSSEPAIGARNTSSVTVPASAKSIVAWTRILRPTHRCTQVLKLVYFAEFRELSCVKPCVAEERGREC
jgi:hypothetical protein